MVINATNITMTVYPSVAEDGSVCSTSSRKYQIQLLDNGSIEGLTDASREIIEKYDLNSKLNILFRKNVDLISDLANRIDEHQRRPIHYFRNSLIHIDTLNKNASKHTMHTENLLRSMLYANSFSALESLLSDYLISSLEANEKILSNMGSEYEPFKVEKYTLKNLIADNRSPLELAIEKIQGVVFHNLITASKIYTAAFRIKFPDFGHLVVAINNRHDIVHRNGCKVGHEHPKVYRQEEVQNLIIEMQSFVIDLLNKLIDKEREDMV